jgi:hypothetical protein
MTRNARYAALALALPAAVAAVVLASPAAVRAQSPAAPSLPDAPTAPAVLPFADEVAGRRALFAARDAYRNGAGVRFTATVKTLNRAAGQTAARAVGPALVESVTAAPQSQRLNLAQESGAPGSRVIRRVISNGESLVVTRFEEKPKGAPPVREVVRLPLVGEVQTLERGLTMLKVRPETEAGRLALEPDWTVRGTVWRVGAPASGIETIAEAEAATTDGRVRRQRFRRYRLDAKTRLLRSFEEWDVMRDLRNGDGKNSRSRTTYRREDYSGASAGSPPPASAFVQTVPANYQEVAVPAGDIPESTGPLEADARALAVLDRWDRAWKRFTSLSSQVTLTTDALAKAVDSRPVPEAWRDQQAEFTVQVRRPARVYVRVAPVAKPAAASSAGNDPRGRRGGRGGREESPFPAQTVVSDGEVVALTEGGAGGGRRARPVEVGPDPARLGERMRRAGYADATQTLNWLFDGPRSVYAGADTVAYKGETTVGGVVTDVVEITEYTRSAVGGRRRRGTGQIESTEVTRVYIGKDGLPRGTERYRTQSIEGGIPRDDPPDLLFRALYRNVQADTPVAMEMFRLPTAVVQAARSR